MDTFWATFVENWAIFYSNFWSHLLPKCNYHCRVDLLFNWFGFTSLVTHWNHQRIYFFGWIQTSKTDQPCYSNTSPYETVIHLLKNSYTSPYEENRYSLPRVVLKRSSLGQKSLHDQNCFRVFKSLDNSNINKGRRAFPGDFVNFQI